MKKVLLISIWIGITAIPFGSCAPRPPEIALLTPTNDPALVTDQAQIQAASILIVVQSSPTFNDLSVAYGIGTLVERRGEVFLLTHNHWGEILENDMATVELRDARNRLISPLFASTFKELIVYQDPGTLVLQATSELLEYAKPAKIAEASLLEAGTLIQVAYRRLPERNTVSVLQAEVVRTAEFEDQPIYQIRSLDGQGLQKGDSGGGVWYGGKLVGNNWAILVDKKPVDSASQAEPLSTAVSGASYTAALPDFFQARMGWFEETD